MLDVSITEELKEEGIARDVVRAIQQARKAADLNIADRVILDIQSDDSTAQQALLKWHDYICTQTLGTTFHSQHSIKMIKQERVEIESAEIVISIYF